MKSRYLAMAVSLCLMGQILPLRLMAATPTDPAAVTAKSVGGGPPSAKRVAPATVGPIVIGNRRFEVVHWGRDRGLPQNGGYIAALDSVSGKELWLLRVYVTQYDKSLESDVQDVFIKSMSKKFFSDKLKITDENGRLYLVNIQDRTVTPQ